MRTKKQLEKVINHKFSGFQLDILESALEFALQDDSFPGNNKLIAEVLLEDIKDLK